MINKKLRLPLFLAASFLLVGCSSDTIVARPTGWINDKIFVEAGDKDNKMKAIYDAVKNLGDTNSNVLNTIMYKIAKTHIGKFEKDDNNDTDLTLREIYKNKDVADYHTTEKFKQFVDSHPKYKAEEESAYLDGTTTKVVKIEGDDKYKVSLNKIVNQYDEIVENIYEKLFDEIKGGSYSLGNSKLFDEEDYYEHLKKELYYPKQKDKLKEDTDFKGFVKDKAFFSKPADLTWKKYVNFDSSTSQTTSGFLHVVKQGDNAVSYGIYDNYINDKILPELYKTYLTQTYVKEQRTSSLGRSYARKVNMVTIPLGTDIIQKEKILNMANFFAKKYITGTKLGDESSPDFSEYDLELFNKALSGFVGDGGESGETPKTKEYDLLTSEGAGNFERITLNDENKNPLTWRCYTDETGAPNFEEGTEKEIPGGQVTHVYKGTKLGELVEKFSLIYNLTDTEETSTTDPTKYSRKFTATPKEHLDEEAIKAYNDITNNGTYTIAEGMAIKEKEARLLDMTKDGWFLKNGGLTDLDSKYRDRLFNIKTSTTIDEKESKEAIAKFIAGDYVKYFGNKDSTLSSRKAFLVTDSSSRESSPWTSVVLQGDSNLYIVEVKEAVNSSKVSTASNAKSYFAYKAVSGTPVAESGKFETAQIVDKLTNEIVKANSSSDTYKKNANEYYLMISNIIFYDQSVYDYFKSQFPDLFK